MYDDFSKLAEQAERARAAKVAKFLELYRDPDLAHIVAMLRNGNGQVQSDPKEEGPREISTRPVGFKSGNGIQETIRGLALAPKFTSDDVIFNLTNQKFPISAKDQKGAVRDALFKLTHGKKPAFRIVGRGKGGRSIYERI